MAQYTAADVANFMAAQIDQNGRIYQDQIVTVIGKEFSQEFTYNNEYGNMAIRRDVLRAFKKVTGDTVVWMRGDRCWRKRIERDRGGREQS